MSSPPRGASKLALNRLLALLPLLAVLPMLVFSLALLALGWKQQREQALREVQQSARTLAVAVDRELAASVRELERLAEFPLVSEGTLADFRTYAQRLVHEQEAWDNLSLSDPVGRQLLNVEMPDDKRIVDRPEHQAAFSSGRPALSDVYRHSVSGAPSIALSVPVQRDGRVRWVLSARLNTQTLSQLLADQAVAPGLVAAILDRRMTLIARSRDHAAYVGKPATADLRAAAADHAKGTAELSTLDGMRTVAAWETLPSGWRVVVGLPRADLDGAILRQIGWLALAALATLAFSLAVTLTLAKRLERGVASAIDDARALADGRTPPARSSRVRELDSLFESLRSTHRRLADAAEREAQAAAQAQLAVERLRLAAESVQLGLFDIDLKSGVIVQSARMAEYYGYRPGEVKDLSQIVERIHPEDRERVRAAIEAAIRVPDPAGYRNEYRVDIGGRVRWLQILGQVITEDGAGGPRASRFIGVGLDITERKEAELALRDADRRKDEFIAMLSHELRNPLTPIANALAILRMQQPAGEEARRALEIGERQVQQMKRLIDDLLDISRITRGKIALRLQPVELGALLRDALEGMLPVAKTRRQRLRMQPPAGPLTVSGDRARLIQVIENLLANALKFSPEGGQVELTAERVGSDALIRVRDEGIGIPPEKLALVFEIFTQLDAGIDRSQGGLGIGLALVKQLVQMHGGRVQADSEGLGKGATFSIMLPLRVDPSAASSPAAAAVGASADPGAAPPTRRVLVVDDNEDAADTLAALLQMLGHEAQAVYGGEDALVLAERFAPDTVLLDIGLPGISGLDVCRRLRQRAGGDALRLIAVSGYGTDQDRAATAQAGFDAHLVKPVTAEDVEAALAAPRRRPAAPAG